METKRKCGCRKKSTAQDNTDKAQSYSGIAIDKADGDKVTPALVKERTATLNNNPRNDD